MASFHVAQARVAVIIVRTVVMIPNATLIVFSGVRPRDMVVEVGAVGDLEKSRGWAATIRAYRNDWT